MAEAKSTAQKAAAKPAAKKATAKPAAKKTATAKAVSPAERYKMIEVAAYYIAERNGFAGDAQAFWAEAERQISKQLGE